MAPGWHRRIPLIAGALLVAGCASETTQCGACPPAAYVNLRTLDGATSATQVAYTGRVCVEGLACEDVADEGETVPLTLLPRMKPRELDGRTVTVTVTRTTDGVAQHGTGTLEYREEHGVCACSGVSAQVVLSGK